MENGENVYIKYKCMMINYHCIRRSHILDKNSKRYACHGIQ